MAQSAPQRPVGLYWPEAERDACGVGVIAQLQGHQSHNVCKDALEMLRRMAHRGACGCDASDGDGAGILARIPRHFFHSVCLKAGFTLPEAGQFALGMFFFPQLPLKHELKQLAEQVSNQNGLHVLGWRQVPVNNATLGPIARSAEPAIEQLFLSSPQPGSLSSDALEKKLYVLRQQLLNRARQLLDACSCTDEFHIASLSCYTVVYKGQFTAEQVEEYYPDLSDPGFETDMAMVHSRFSTNTFPSWSRAQPLSSMSHNGEINTVKGNINWMGAREGLIAAQALGLTPDELQSILPIVQPGLSDSGVFNAVLELLMASGRDAPECMMMMVPEAWQNDPLMDPKRRAFYEYMSCLMEPWDGPALVAFTDGRYLGATLDRNGLRPGRFYETTDGRLILASEFGVVDVPPELIKSKGCLTSGKMLMIDFEEHRIIQDHELKARFVNRFPFQDWLNRQKLDISSFCTSPTATPHEEASAPLGLHGCLSRLTNFGWSQEALDLLFFPMFRDEVEALGSMGNDSPLACLSHRPRLLYDYFKQLFAQVTNPPLDSVREYVVMSLEAMVGPEGDLTACTEAQANRLSLKTPFLRVSEVEGLARGGHGWSTVTLDASFPVSEGTLGLQRAIARLQHESEAAVRAGACILILSDQQVGEKRAAVSSLLAVGAVHHHLIKQRLRLKTALVVDSSEAREVHHFCLLIGFGVDAVCPRLALEVIERLREDPRLPSKQDGTRFTARELADRFFHAAEKGILKVMAKMGISTLASYKGAQIFEAVGLHDEVVQTCFYGTPSRISGLGFAQIAEAYLALHALAYPEVHLDLPLLPNLGDYHYRSNEGSEVHLNDPMAMAKLQEAARQGSKAAYQDYARIINELNKHATIRGLLRFRAAPGGAIPLDQVEPAQAIVKRFATGAMSYGSISLEAHSTLAVAMNRIGAKSNTGEGGEAHERLLPGPDGGLNPARSAIKQVASARFGVTSLYLTYADELQIKMAQGAKPGEGGELPGRKVNSEIAKVRHSTPGVGLISPPPHHDIYSIEDLKELIFDLKNANPAARISVKLVSEVGVGVVAAGVCKGGAHHVLVSGHDGGTGASRWTGIKHAGLPWELGLAETHQTLVLNDLRRRIVVQTDGQLKTGRDIAIAALLGAEEFCFATAPLIALGCIMMRKCHLNTCPVGIATQDPELRKKFAGQPEHVINFFFMMAEEARGYMAQMGFRSLDEMVGRADMLEVDEALLAQTPQYACFDLANTVLKPARTLRPDVPQRCVESQPDELAGVFDQFLIEQAAATLADPNASTVIHATVSNTNRAVGTMLSHTVTKRYGPEALCDNRILVHLQGSAGQSFGAWLCGGITLQLEGDANDYVGKGLCGGRLVIRPPRGCTFASDKNMLLGNVAAYGATSGQLFLRGRAAERFCVRNSGALAVVEGVGDHGCEYMTGGCVVILGETGRNFAAGMSGGLAFVLDVDGGFATRCNMELVDLDPVTAADDALLCDALRLHLQLTESPVAQALLADWESSRARFVKVFPRDYKQVLAQAAELALASKQQRSRAKVGERRTRANGSSSRPGHSEHNQDIEDRIARSNQADQGSSPVLSQDSETDSDDSGVETRRPATHPAPDKKRGFIEYERAVVGYRNAVARVGDWSELGARVTSEDKEKLLKTQTARCMDCGVPFCHQKDTGCPLGNKIPEWNELVHRGDWRGALESLLSTNNFPEFTGRVCPAPCEGACVLGIIEKPVAIKSIECAIIDRGFAEKWITPRPPAVRLGLRVAIVGSGPAGLAAADQLNKAGYSVVVFERADRIGGLMMYGVPNMKCDKEGVVQRRVDLMASEGVEFVTRVEVGKDRSVRELRESFDALLLATGATVPRDLAIDGRELRGIHFAMEFLTQNTQSLLNSKHQDGNFINVAGKRVVVIGGGDTGNDCIGTAMRQGAASVVNFELLPEPPVSRAGDNPWPQWPKIFRVDYGHEEVAAVHGRDPRQYSILSTRFLDDGNGGVKGIETVQVEWQKDGSGRFQMNKVPGTERVFEADFVFLALGFLSPEQGLADDLGVKRDTRSNFAASDKNYATSEEGVFAAGDCRRGQSLVVWAIAEGRGAAASIDRFLRHKTAPVA